MQNANAVATVDIDAKCEQTLTVLLSFCPCCRYYAESDPQDGHRLISLAADQVFGGAEVAFPAYWDGPEVMNSLEESKSRKIVLEPLLYGHFVIH